MLIACCCSLIFKSRAIYNQSKNLPVVCLLMFLVALMQDAVLPALVPVVDAHLVSVTSCQKLKPFDVKCEMLVNCSKS